MCIIFAQHEGKVRRGPGKFIFGMQIYLLEIHPKLLHQGHRMEAKATQAKIA